jgi:hypothetical protein
VGLMQRPGHGTSQSLGASGAIASGPSLDRESRFLDALAFAPRAASGFGEAGAVAKNVTATQARAGDGDELFSLAGSGTGDVGKVGVDLFDGDTKRLRDLAGSVVPLGEKREHLLPRGLIGGGFGHGSRQGDLRSFERGR